MKYNPNGRIPTLIDHNNNDFTIWYVSWRMCSLSSAHSLAPRESNAIMQYLVEKYDTEHKISVSNFEEKMLQLQWLFFQSSGQGCVPSFWL